MPLRRTISILTCAAALALNCEHAFSQQFGNKLEAPAERPQGVLEPWRMSKVACSETGLIHEVYVKLGDRVKVGDPIAQLKSDAIRLQLDMAETQVAAAGRIETAQAEVQLNERKVAAFTEARKNDFTSQLELERAQMELATSRGRLKTEIEERKVLEARAAQLRQLLKDRLVVAPIAGHVTEIHRETGELVAANAPEIVTISDVSKLRARFYLTEQEIDSISPSQIVDVELSSGKRVVATVEDIAPVADKESGSIVLSVLIDNLNSDIRSSRCTLLIETPSQ